MFVPQKFNLKPFAGDEPQIAVIKGGVDSKSSYESWKLCVPLQI